MLCTSGHPVQVGSFSDIHLGHDSTGRMIALKRIRHFASGDRWLLEKVIFFSFVHPFTYERLTIDVFLLQKIKKETRIWEGLRHSNILPFLGTVSDGLDFFMASPWQRNGNLLQYMQINPNANRPLLVSHFVILHRRNSLSSN